MTETNITTRPFYVATSNGSVWCRERLLACGSDRQQVRHESGDTYGAYGYTTEFASRLKAVERYPQWEDKFPS